uniref:SH2 domain-containing protein n=1 Tax=Macrostomum lignano TaxID=282301 RepID=A0A1I8J8F7_9PLAT
AQPLAAERLPSSTGSAVAAAASAPTSSALAPTATGGSLYGDTADSSYEEAWDIRMQKRGITLGGRPLAPAAAAPAAAAGAAAPQAAAPEPDYDYAYGSGGGELRHAMQRSLSLQDHQGGGDARPAVPARSVAATAAAGHPPVLQERRSDEDRVSIGSYDEPWEGGESGRGRRWSGIFTVVPGFPIAVPPPVPPHKTQQQHQQHQSGSPPVRLRSTVAASGIRQSQPAQLVRQESGPAAAASGASSSSSEPLIDSNLALSDQPWFYEVGVNRQSAESLLKAYPEGAFLVRTCESDTGQYSLSLRGRIESQFLHMKIERNKAGQFVLGQYSQPFQSGADQMILKMPVVRAGRRPQPTGNNHYV